MAEESATQIVLDRLIQVVVAKVTIEDERDALRDRVDDLEDEAVKLNEKFDSHCKLHGSVLDRWAFDHRRMRTILDEIGHVVNMKGTDNMTKIEGIEGLLKKEFETRAAI